MLHNAVNSHISNNNGKMVGTTEERTELSIAIQMK